MAIYDYKRAMTLGFPRSVTGMLDHPLAKKFRPQNIQEVSKDGAERWQGLGFMLHLLAQSLGTVGQYHHFIFGLSRAPAGTCVPP